jgi:hypothetical protein
MLISNVSYYCALYMEANFASFLHSCLYFCAVYACVQNICVETVKVVKPTVNKTKTCVYNLNFIFGPNYICKYIYLTCTCFVFEFY